MLKLRDVMSRDLVAFAPETSLIEAIEMLAERHVSGAPVLSGDRLVGVLTTTDIHEFVASNPVALAAHSMGGAASMQVLREHHGLERVVVVAAPASLSHHMADLSRRVGLSPAAHENLVDRMELAHKPVAELDALSGLPLGRTRALFVHDRDDAEVSFAHLARFGDLWPGSELMATEGYGHYKVLGAPEVVSRAVGFLAGA